MEPFQGPQSLADRGSAKENYNASCQKHKFYSRKVFDAALADQNEGRPLLPHAATEKQFVDALRVTSDRMHSTHYIRNAANARFQFRGPQCMPHRDDIERLGFEPSALRETASGSAPNTSSEASSLPMLQCSHPCCQKWRRVDGATQELFSNKAWWTDRLGDEEKQLYQQCPEFDTLLSRW